MKLLYSKQSGKEIFANDLALDVEIESFFSGLNGLFIQGERRDIKQAAVRMIFSIMTHGKAKIYYIKGPDDAVLHTSYLIPKCFKFPFMSKNDYQIGPCFTDPAARGRGIYPKVLQHICKENQRENSVFYMTVNSKNISSVKGIEKAGFVCCGEIRETKVLKRYYQNEC